MSYFKDKYSTVSFKKAHEGGSGLRNAQLGAIHAIASHFTLYSEPAIITMPTGSGKTAVLMMAPYLLEAKRVLVVAPSKMLRGQIEEEFSTLSTLKEIGVLSEDVAIPKIREISHRVDSADKWNELREYDVCISTPNCISPSLDQIPRPPSDLFDLILIDEAHHTPAKTWNGILESFPTVKKILFTATPFRRDKREIKGRFVYAYPLSRAYQDEIFGQIEFVPVKEGNNPDENDVRLAIRAQEVFEADKKSGLNHRLMIRTDKKNRADYLLEEVYQKHTTLNLQVIHSGHSFRRIKDSLEALRNGNLDGIISVDMLGEGFNFPNLKIAVIHTPHKSLEVTLQFIGRFARTNADDVDVAKFLAIPNEIEIEGERLFQEGAAWLDIITNVSQVKTQTETRSREFLQKFELPAVEEVEAEDLSLYSLSPRRHVKIYHAGDVDLSADIQLSRPTEIIYKNVNQEQSTLVLVTRDVGKPKWAKSDTFVEAKYELIVVFHDVENQLLFINSSRSIDNLYKKISSVIAPTASPLATSEVNRVLNNIDNPKFFSIGMRNRVAVSSKESYRILAGSNTANAINESDGHLYRQGHAYATGQKNGHKVTLGFSSSSKVWGSASSQIPLLVEWCREIGRKIKGPDSLVTNSGFDIIEDGEVVDMLPEGIVFADWDSGAYNFNDPFEVTYLNSSGEEVREHISELDLIVNTEESSSEKVIFSIKGQDIELKIQYTISTFEPIECTGDEIGVINDNERMPILEFINDFVPVVFYTADFAQLRLNELFSYEEGSDVYNVDQIEVVDWSEAAVNIQNEEGESSAGEVSIHEFLKQRLTSDKSNTVVYYDHGTGETADFVVIKRSDDLITYQLYHCKGAAGPTPGSRVEDVYEVCGQAVKSLKWAHTFNLYNKIKARKKDEKFLVGDYEIFKKITTDETKSIKTVFEVIIVQPGLKRTALRDNVLKSISSTKDYVSQAGHALRIIASE